MIDPVVSVLLPTYNRPAWLKEALDSLIEQDVPIQLIILNNGSNDAYTSCIIHDYAHKFADFIHLHSDTNSFENMGSMLGNATCDYVVNFCDDDRMLPGNLREKIKMLEMSPLAAFAFSPAESIDKEGLRDGKIIGCHSKLAMSFDDLLPTSIPVMSSVVMRRETLSVPISHIDSMYGEWTQYLEVLNNGWIAAYTDKPMTELRVHEMSDTVQRGEIGCKALESHFNTWFHWLSIRKKVVSKRTLQKCLDVYGSLAVEQYGQTGHMIDSMRRMFDLYNRHINSCTE